MSNTELWKSESEQSKGLPFELSPRTAKCLKYASIRTTDEVQSLAETTELLRIPNFGQKSLNELREIMTRLGYDTKNWLSVSEASVIRAALKREATRKAGLSVWLTLDELVSLASGKHTVGCTNKFDKALTRLTELEINRIPMRACVSQSPE